MHKLSYIFAQDQTVFYLDDHNNILQCSLYDFIMMHQKTVYFNCKEVFELQIEKFSSTEAIVRQYEETGARPIFSGTEEECKNHIFQLVWMYHFGMEKENKSGSKYYSHRHEEIIKEQASRCAAMHN